MTRGRGTNHLRDLIKMSRVLGKEELLDPAQTIMLCMSTAGELSKLIKLDFHFLTNKLQEKMAPLPALS